MPILERITKPENARHWPDSIPLEYHYTAGVAGEEFLRELKERGRLLASKCPKCKNAFLPARMYCPDCYIESKDRLVVDQPGYVYAYSNVTRDLEGKKLASPMTIALVRFNGVKGGIVHWLRTGLQKPRIGMKVSPNLKQSSDRKGSLSDIIAFEPV